MKIRLCVPLGGNGFSVAPGEETDRFDDEEAQRYIDAGYAVLADGVTATPEKSERGALPGGERQPESDTPSGEGEVTANGAAGNGEGSSANTDDNVTVGAEQGGADQSQQAAEGASSVDGADAAAGADPKAKKSSGKKSKGDS